MRVLMFPGQSSADPQMLVRVAAMHPAARDVIRRACDVLGDRASRYVDPAGATLETNRDVQLAVFLATQMHLAALVAEGCDGEISVGLSLGEYSHLVHIGALAFEDALRLVDARGAAYDESPVGMMAAVMAVDGPVVNEVMLEAAAHGVVAVSNYNTPTQHVIAGETEAVAWACARLEDEHLAHTVVIERRVPMHTTLLSDVATHFMPVLERASWTAPTRPYLPNVMARWVPGAQPSDFVTHLTDHVTRAVRWRESIEMILAAHPGAVCVEVGPGQVLANMFGRRWVRPTCVRTDAKADIDPAAHFRMVIETLRDELCRTEL